MVYNILLCNYKHDKVFIRIYYRLFANKGKDKGFFFSQNSAFPSLETDKLKCHFIFCSIFAGARLL